MPDIEPVPSVASLGDRVGTACEQHLVPSFSLLVSGEEYVCRGEGFLSLATLEPHPFANFALVTDTDSLDVTREALAQLPSDEAPTAMIYPVPSPGPGIEAELTERGYALAETMPAMAIDIDDLTPTSLPEGYAFGRLTEERRDEWIETLGTGYEIPPICAAAFTPRDAGADRSADAQVQIFAVTRDDRIVATSLLLLTEGLAGIYCVATLPDERGKGLGAHATAEPLRLIGEQGYRVGVLLSSAAGHSVYRRLGFGGYGQVPVYVRMPA